MTKRVEFDYDPFDRLIAKRVDDDGDSTLDRSYTFVYDGPDLIFVFDDAGSLTHRFLHGPAVDQVFADEDALGEVLWSLGDNQQTVSDVVDYDATLDETTVVNHLTYSAYGEITSESNGSYTPIHAYTGQVWDEDVGAYHYNARWYDPAVGRFISEDPAGFGAGDTNLARYVSNNPANFVDPTGRSADVFDPAVEAAEILGTDGRLLPHSGTDPGARPGPVQNVANLPRGFRIGPPRQIEQSGFDLAIFWDNLTDRGGWKPGTWTTWLYTGDPQAPPNVMDAAIDASGEPYLHNAGAAHQTLDSIPVLGGATSEVLEWVEGEDLHDAVVEQLELQQIAADLAAAHGAELQNPADPGAQAVFQYIQLTLPILIFIAGQAGAESPEEPEADGSSRDANGNLHGTNGQFIPDPTRPPADDHYLQRPHIR